MLCHFYLRLLVAYQKDYYIRQFLFGSIFFTFMAVIGYNNYSHTGNSSIFLTNIILGLICLFLYPYSRFVYESIIEYILGNNVFFVNALFMLIIKFITMMLCFVFAVFIAPIGLTYLYFYHSKQEKLQNQNEKQ